MWELMSEGGSFMPVEPLTPTGLLFAWMQLLLSSNSAGNLNDLSRPEWSQQDEVMKQV